jgi:hypothetical protein
MINSTDFASYGFKSEGRTSHNSRTMMFKELAFLLETVNTPSVSKNGYIKAITEDNCLGKKSGITRKLSASHLENLYALDPGLLIFRALRFFWQRDIAARPLLAFTCVYTRDYLVRGIAPIILEKKEEEVITKEPVKEAINELRPGSFTAFTLESTTRNILSTFTQSGHISGKVEKKRAYVNPTAGSIAYALLLGHISGYRGEALLSCEYVRLLDASLEKTIECAESASRSGWLSFRHIDTIYDVSFPHRDLGVEICVK